MTKPKSAASEGLEPHYKIRVVMRGGGLLHLASTNEPARTDSGWQADWITDHRYGDTPGYINWADVSAITWRWSQ